MSPGKLATAITAAACFALSACSTYETNPDNKASAGDTSMAPANTGMDAASTMSTPGNTDAAATTPLVSYGIVQAIDPVAPQDVAVGTIGGAAVGGTLSPGTGTVYRTTMRMDDGSTRSVIEQAQPAYHVGDRVRLSNGMVQPN